MTVDLNTTFGHRPIHIRGASLFLCAALPPSEPAEPVEPAPPLSFPIKGQRVPGLTQGSCLQKIFKNPLQKMPTSYIITFVAQREC